MEDYEIALRKWAAERMNARRRTDAQLTWRDVEKVALEGDSGSPDWSSWTPGEPPTFSVTATARREGPGRYATVILDMDDETIDFSQLLGEILAIEITDEDRLES